MNDKTLKIPVECWSRVVGYFRPISQWNPGKREEFKDRKPYNIGPARFYEVKDES